MMPGADFNRRNYTAFLAPHSVSPKKIEGRASALKSKRQISYTNANMVELQFDAPQKAAHLHPYAEYHRWSEDSA